MDVVLDVLKAPETPNQFGGHDTDETQPLRSAAGWYIGDLYYDQELEGYFPHSRDSLGYWPTRAEVVEVMKSGKWAQRW